MHEIGMLYQTAKIASSYADENNISEVKKITIEIGELSGVLPEIFKEYFPYVAEKYPKLLHAEIDLRQVPGEGLCSNCKSIYNVMKNKGQCPKCKSTQKTILGGRDVKLIHIYY